MRASKKAAMATMRAMLTACVLLTFVSCQDGPFIRITVDGRGPEINRLKFSGTIAGQTVPKNFDKGTVHQARRGKILSNPSTTLGSTSAAFHFTFKWNEIT